MQVAQPSPDPRCCAGAHSSIRKENYGFVVLPPHQGFGALICAPFVVCDCGSISTKRVYRAQAHCTSRSVCSACNCAQIEIRMEKKEEFFFIYINKCYCCRTCNRRHRHRLSVAASSIVLFFYLESEWWLVGRTIVAIVNFVLDLMLCCYLDGTYGNGTRPVDVLGNGDDRFRSVWFITFHTYDLFGRLEMARTAWLCVWFGANRNGFR